MYSVCDVFSLSEKVQLWVVLALGVAFNLHGPGLGVVPYLIVIGGMNSTPRWTGKLLLGLTWSIMPVVPISLALSYAADWPLAMTFGYLVYLPIWFLALGHTLPRAVVPRVPFLLLHWLVWDLPLVCWAQVMHALGQRAFFPFYSEIEDAPCLLSVGSMPLCTEDIAFLASKGVAAVVSMQQEHEAVCRDAVYDTVGIAHFRVATTDLTEPTHEGLLAALEFLAPFVQAQKRVFVHCKGGQNRAVIMAMCVLMYHGGCGRDDAMALIKRSRPKATGRVKHNKCVRRIERLSEADSKVKFGGKKTL